MLWIVFGAGAQGRITLEILQAAHPDDEFQFADDDPKLQRQSRAGQGVLSRHGLASLVGRGDARAIVALGQNHERLRIAADLSALGLKFGNAVHPSAVVSPSADLGVGITICPQSVIGVGARIGNHVLVNSAAIVDHDCTLGEGAALAPGVHMAGRVTVGPAAFIGTGASIRPRINIGAGAIVGAGAVVTKSVGPDLVAYGVPAREIRLVDIANDWKKIL